MSPAVLGDLTKALPCTCIANFRHPAEVALSLMDAARKGRENSRGRFDQYDPWDAATSQLRFQVNNFLAWKNSSNTIPVYFDDIVKDPLSLFGRVAESLGLDRLTFNHEISLLLEDTKSIVEFNKGVTGRRFNELTPQDLEQIESEYDDMIAYMDDHQKLFKPVQCC
jgi:hypothetical protein